MVMQKTEQAVSSSSIISKRDLEILDMDRLRSVIENSYLGHGSVTRERRTTGSQRETAGTCIESGYIP